jgi:hypothetical protein
MSFRAVMLSGLTKLLTRQADASEASGVITYPDPVLAGKPRCFATWCGGAGWAVKPLSMTVMMVHRDGVRMGSEFGLRVGAGGAIMKPA